MPIEISFNHKSAVFRPGDVISGYVIIFVPQKLKTKGVELEWHGKVFIRNKNNQTGKHLIFRTTQRLTGEDAEVAFETGETRLPFRQRLPNPLPPSYVGIAEYGRVTYKVEARFKRDWQDSMVTVCTERTFYVITVKELTANHMKLHQYTERVKTTTACFCLPMIELSFTLDKTGYVPGESIQIRMDATNYSGQQITGMSIRLIQITSIVCSAGYSYQRGLMSELELEDIVIPAKLSQHPLPVQNLNIPALNPSYEGAGDIMSVKYEIQILIVTPTFYRDFVATLPVTIATYPFDVTSRLRKLPTLPKDGEVITPAPSADLDSSDFVNSLETVTNTVGNETLHFAVPESNDDANDSSDNGDTQGFDNPLYRNSFSRKSSIDALADGKEMKKPKCIFYERFNDAYWSLHYVRCGQMKNNVKKTNN